VIFLIDSFLFGLNPGMQRAMLIFISVWSIVWKGLALWKSAKKNQKYWFIVLLVINTLGLLEIVYIVFFSKDKKFKFNFLKKKK